MPLVAYGRSESRRVNILAVIKMLNQMEADGVVERYAIGGAVAATFYLEPVSTLDVDVFIGLHPVPGALVVTLQPIYDYLIGRNGVVDQEYIVVEGTPVRFLPPGGPLVEEALREAVEQDVEGTNARVFTAEHLAAIALQAGRAKDKARVLQFIEEGALDAGRFQLLLTRHGLKGEWQRFQRQFLDEEAMSFDLQKVLESKRAYRKKLAALPIAEKLRILEQLSERAAVIQRSRPLKSRVEIRNAAPVTEEVGPTSPRERTGFGAKAA